MRQDIFDNRFLQIGLLVLGLAIVVNCSSGRSKSPEIDRQKETGDAEAKAPANPTGTEPSAPTKTPTTAPSALGAIQSRMVGTWENAEKTSYFFRADGTYTGIKGARTADGKWRVLAVTDESAGEVLIELVSPGGNIVLQKWRVGGEGTAEMSRLTPPSATTFKRKV
jgi:hypothetical protein